MPMPIPTAAPTPSLRYFLIVIILLNPLLSHASFVPSLQRPYLKALLRKACQTKDQPTIFRLTEELRPLNPTPDILADFSKLAGDWKLEFTTAPTQEVPDETSTGVRTYQNVEIDGAGGCGIIYNVIDRGLPEKGLRIAVGAEPTRKDRVALDFRTIEASNDRFPRKVTLRFPPRAFFRAAYGFGKLVKGESFDEREFKEIGHFDLLYLDEDLRIQRNSEGNLFVNSRI